MATTPIACWLFVRITEGQHPGPQHHPGLLGCLLYIPYWLSLWFGGPLWALLGLAVIIAQFSEAKWSRRELVQWLLLWLFGTVLFLISFYDPRMQPIRSWWVD
jgi:hypothetical protein